MTTVGVMQRDAASAEFFAGTARGELMVKRCGGCRRWIAPPVLYCPACGSDDVAWTASAGAGAIASWSVVHPRRGLESASPTVIGIVELDEGPWVFGRIVGTSADDVASGQRVSVEFVRPEGGEAIPVFRVQPAGNPADEARR